LKRKGNAEEEAEARFDDNEESGEGEPNLDWMPDPDKIYGPKGSDEESDEFFPETERNQSASKRGKRRQEEEEHSSDSGSEDPSEEPTLPEPSKSNPKKSKFDTKSLDKGIMEELALKLLQH